MLSMPGRKAVISPKYWVTSGCAPISVNLSVIVIIAKPCHIVNALFAENRPFVLYKIYNTNQISIYRSDKLKFE